MNIVMYTTYYHPHVSGLTLHFKRLAEHFVKQGHKVTLITVRHDKNLPLNEAYSGVNIVRVPYLFKINKGHFVPHIMCYAWRSIQQADIVHLNLPSLEALFIALSAKLLGKKLVSTYVCDLQLPSFWGSRIFTTLIDLNHRLILKLSDRITSFTLDFARHSRVLHKFVTGVVEISPPLEIPVHFQKVEILTNLKAQGYTPLIGMATRFASEKGIEFCLEALPALKSQFPHIKLVLAGDMNVVGEYQYLKSLNPLLEKYEADVYCVGRLNQNQMVHFYEMIDLLVVASTNSTEAFGIIQIEAMAHGTPVVATDLPGVTIPIRITGMGEIARKADSDDLSEKIIRVLTSKNNYHRDTHEIRTLFSADNAAQKYMDLYSQTLNA
jgi:glycosyltransferase involved in cell wall biosynthesis